MPISKRQLAASLLSTLRIEARDMMVGFLQLETTKFLDAPFANTRAAVVRQVWGTRGMEFRALDIEVVGLCELLHTLQALPSETPLVQEILRSGPHTLYVFHYGDGCQIVGAVLHGKANIPLPVSIVPRRGRKRSRIHSASASSQLDLFAAVSA
ncbi:hypothetical protein ASF24_17690 [Methylobacterium sp. Leaf86]|uniref:hypothetical protein n=1 Tax=Methylobacterium sp. Leaf86 TaxID=1736242 RepID=UPI0006F33E1D|nr:hypothetical protein [Methylobacterium sp. Leaf86]KQO57351.1 hypothetical protein ASF24_17690 [Methylobacterium sp. Leaf86]